MTAPAGLGRRLSRPVDPLASDSPWTARGFWLLQVGVVLIYLVRLGIEVRVVHGAVPSIPDFTTTALFLPPVLFAAVTFGPTGAVATSLWILILSLPRDLAYLADHNPVGAWAENTQLATLCIIAFVVGRRVTAERGARVQAETARLAHLAAEARYRTLFEANTAPILLVDGGGVILEANAAGLATFPASRRPDPGRRLEDVVGWETAWNLLVKAREAGEDQLPGGDQADEEVLVRVDAAGAPLRFRAEATLLNAPDRDGLVQVVLNDVTALTRRQEWVEGYAASVLQAQEEERRHLAQELHDGPLQALVHLCRRIDAAGARSGPGVADGEFFDLRAMALRTVDELRGISRGLRPSILDDLGLVAAIGRLVDDLGAREGVEASFDVQGVPARLPTSLELALFRVAQEALSNVEHHAQAGRVGVTLTFDAEGIRLLVTDDGVGFEPDPGGVPTSPGSLGLAGMRERLHLAGGRVEVRSAPGSGTTIDAWTPVPSVQANPA